MGWGICFGVILLLLLVVNSDVEVLVEGYCDEMVNMFLLWVLLVEDDVIVVDVVCGLLSVCGYEVVYVGYVLVVLCEISVGDFDVGLLDLDLLGLSGFELV